MPRGPLNIGCVSLVAVVSKASCDRCVDRIATYIRCDRSDSTTVAIRVQGQEVVILEAMKMEHTVSAPSKGTVVLANYTEGELVDEGAALVTLKSPDPSARG